MYLEILESISGGFIVFNNANNQPLVDRKFTEDELVSAGIFPKTQKKVVVSNEVIKKLKGESK